MERGRGRVVVKMCEYEGDWGSIWRGRERGWGTGGWEREVGIGGGRGVFWNFFFLRNGFIWVNGDVWGWWVMTWHVLKEGLGKWDM